MYPPLYVLCTRCSWQRLAWREWFSEYLGTHLINYFELDLIINALIKSNQLKLKICHSENLGIHLINYFELGPHYKCFYLIWVGSSDLYWICFVFEYFRIFFEFECVLLYLAHRAVVDKLGYYDKQITPKYLYSNLYLSRQAAVDSIWQGVVGQHKFDTWVGELGGIGRWQRPTFVTYFTSWPAVNRSRPQEDAQHCNLEKRQIQRQIHKYKDKLTSGGAGNICYLLHVLTSGGGAAQIGNRIVEKLGIELDEDKYVGNMD